MIHLPQYILCWFINSYYEDGQKKDFFLGMFKNEISIHWLCAGFVHLVFTELKFCWSHWKNNQHFFDLSLKLKKMPLLSSCPIAHVPNVSLACIMNDVVVSLLHPISQTFWDRSGFCGRFSEHVLASNLQIHRFRCVMGSALISKTSPYVHLSGSDKFIISWWCFKPPKVTQNAEMIARVTSEE